MEQSNSSRERTDEQVYRTESTYYNPVVKEWLKGIFTINRTFFEFLVGNDDDENPPFHLSLPLITISAVKKKNHLFFYPALVIEIGSEVHWFASFKSRDSVYNMIELFWRNILMTRPVQNSSLSTNHIRCSSLLGKRLLGMLHESEETLAHTARALEEQSHQLHETQESVQELNSDLEIAEKAMKTIPVFPSIAGPFGHTLDEKTHKIKTKKYKIAFSDSNANEWEQGSIIISEEIFILDEEENVKLHVVHPNLTLISVVSPWELLLTIRKDEHNALYTIMCPMMAALVKHLASHPVFCDKIKYTEVCDNLPSNTLGLCQFNQLSTCSTNSNVPSGQLRSIIEDGSIECSTEASLTDEEIQTLSTALSNLQMQASEVFREQASQSDKISELVSDMIKTELRVSADNKMLRKLS